MAERTEGEFSSLSINADTLPFNECGAIPFVPTSSAKFSWTDERIATAREMRDAGVLAPEIADHFGASLHSTIAILGWLKRQLDRTWTRERLVLLCEGWAAGSTATQIADELGGGITRSAVLGKVFRLGLAKRRDNTPVQRSKPKKPKIARAPKSPKVQRLGLLHSPQFAMQYRERAERPVEMPPPVPLNVSLLDLEFGQCRNVEDIPRGGVALYCGHPTVKNGSWCAYHHQAHFTTVVKAINEDSADYLAGRTRAPVLDDLPV